jgi:hypothetical protein
VPYRYFCAGSNRERARVFKFLNAFVFVFAANQSVADQWGFSITPHTHWNEDDSYRQWMYLTAHTMDWLQTRYIATHSDIYYESNPVLGREPKQETVDAYFFSTAVLHSWIAYSLHPRYRKWFQYSTIVMETGYVGHNISLGIGFQF